jgi:nitrate reductase gamma subunit
MPVSATNDMRVPASRSGIAPLIGMIAALSCMGNTIFLRRRRCSERIRATCSTLSFGGWNRRQSASG